MVDRKADRGVESGRGAGCGPLWELLGHVAVPGDELTGVLDGHLGRDGPGFDGFGHHVDRESGQLEQGRPGGRQGFQNGRIGAREGSGDRHEPLCLVDPEWEPGCDPLEELAGVFGLGGDEFCADVEGCVADVGDDPLCPFIQGGDNFNLGAFREAHAPDSTLGTMNEDEPLDVFGYVQCKCGSYLPDTSERPAPPMCPKCRSDLRERTTAARLTYEVQGRTFHTPERVRKPAKRKKKPTKEALETRRAIDRAKIRAYVRLAHIYRPMFELLFNEEKLREGLHPDTKSIRPRPRAVAEELLADVAEAQERAERAG